MKGDSRQSTAALSEERAICPRCGSFMIKEGEGYRCPCCGHKGDESK